MKKIAFILTLLVVNITLTYAQNVSDSISVKKVFGGYQFYQGDEILNMNQITATLNSNELALKQLKSARVSSTIAYIFTYAGGYLVGWTIGTALRGDDPEWIMAGMGAGLIAVGIPFNMLYINKVKQAVDTYNGGYKKNSFWDNSELKLSYTANGVGLTLNF